MFDLSIFQTSVLGLTVAVLSMQVAFEYGPSPLVLSLKARHAPVRSVTAEPSEPVASEAEATQVAVAADLDEQGREWSLLST